MIGLTSTFWVLKILRSTNSGTITYIFKKKKLIYNYVYKNLYENGE